VTLDLSGLRRVAAARNPRKNDAAVDRMCSSLMEFGFKIPVLARCNGEVVDGHIRLKAARKLGSWPGGDTTEIPEGLEAFGNMAQRSKSAAKDSSPPTPNSTAERSTIWSSSFGVSWFLYLRSCTPPTRPRAYGLDNASAVHFCSQFRSRPGLRSAPTSGFGPVWFRLRRVRVWRCSDAVSSAMLGLVKCSVRLAKKFSKIV